jgi:hypothetical protein
MKSVGPHDQQGSGHMILILSVAIILIGLLGYVYYGNFIEPQSVDNRSRSRCPIYAGCSGVLE